MTAQRKQERCSSLGRIMACPASAQQAGPAIDLPSDMGNMGLGVHADLEDRGNAGKSIDAQAIAEAYGVDSTELLRLADIGWEMRGQIEDAATAGVPLKTCSASAEVALSADLTPELRLTGHLDYLIRVGNRATVIDYKAGRRGDLSNPGHQIRGYLWLVLMCVPDIEHATGVALWLHERATTTYQMSRVDMDSWRDLLIAKLSMPFPPYGPSVPICRYCPYEATCEAHDVLLGSALSVIDGTAHGEITPSRLLQAYVKLRKGELVKAVRSKVATGKKAAEDEFMRELAEQNAVTYTTQHRLTLKTVEEE